MAKIVCVKCGDTAQSKCPHCRNIFPDGGGDYLTREMMSIVEHRIWIEDRDGHAVISFHSYQEEEMTHGDLMVWVSKRLALFTEQELRSLACLHKWEFAEGEISDIGCGHDGRK